MTLGSCQMCQIRLSVRAGSRPTSAGARPSSADADEFAPTPGLRGKIAGGWSATTSGIRNHNPLHRTNDDRPSADIATAHPQQSKARHVMYRAFQLLKF